MKPTMLRIATFVGVFLLIALAVLVVNQTAQFVALMDRFHPTLGTVSLWGLVTLYAACLVVPAVLFLRLPAPLVPPPPGDEEKLRAYRTALAARLRGNPRLAGEAIDEEALDGALQKLGGQADDIIRQSSARVFLATAVSQFGSLSSILVLAAQIRMVWDVAHVYHQRPTPPQLLSLYLNVASTAFVAGRIEDVDAAEHLEPVVSSALGSAFGVIPGLQAATDLFVNAVFTGSTNALLTLRVGIITKRYCGALQRPQKTGLWRSATAEAIGMLRGIVVRGAAQISGAFVSVPGRALGGLGRGAAGAARGAGGAIRRVGGRIVRRRGGEDELPEDGGDPVDGEPMTGGAPEVEPLG